MIHPQPAAPLQFTLAQAGEARPGQWAPGLHSAGNMQPEHCNDRPVASLLSCQDEALPIRPGRFESAEELVLGPRMLLNPPPFHGRIWAILVLLLPEPVCHGKEWPYTKVKERCNDSTIY